MAIALLVDPIRGGEKHHLCPLKMGLPILRRKSKSSMRSFDDLSAKAFSSPGTHSTDRRISLSKSNQNMCLASLLIANLLLPRLIIPRRFRASTCTTTNLHMHRCTRAWRYRRSPNRSRNVEDSTHSSNVNYSLVITSGPPRVRPPNTKSLASVAIAIDTFFWEGQISVSNPRQGR